MMAGQVISSLANPEWTRLFTSFTRSAFRLEGLQHYTDPADGEAFERFRTGKDPEVDLAWWIGLARGHTAAGRSMSRVRVVVEPPSDYTRFELAHFPAMVVAGDNICVISAAPGTWPPDVPRHDFWLFDDRDVWILEYDDAGTFVSAELHDNPQVIADHLRWREAALRQAIPVNDYLVTSTSRAF